MKKINHFGHEGSLEFRLKKVPYAVHDCRMASSPYTDSIAQKPKAIIECFLLSNEKNMIEFQMLSLLFRSALVFNSAQKDRKSVV